jgi:uncharacterized protein
MFMNRVYQLLERLHDIIGAQEPSIERDETLVWERLHSASAARIGWILALERGVDPELAASAAAVHDYGRIITGKQDNHAEASYLPVQNFLKSTGLFTAKEISVIALAVKNHSSKTTVGAPIDEIVKDADVIDCYQYGLPFDRPEKKIRYDTWQEIHQSPGLPECY